MESFQLCFCVTSVVNSVSLSVSLYKVMKPQKWSAILCAGYLIYFQFREMILYTYMCISSIISSSFTGTCLHFSVVKIADKSNFDLLVTSNIAVFILLPIKWLTRLVFVYTIFSEESVTCVRTRYILLIKMNSWDLRTFSSICPWLNCKMCFTLQPCMRITYITYQ